MLVVGRQLSQVAVLEVPVAPPRGEAENGLEAALAQLHPGSLEVSGLRRLGPVVGHVEPGQLIDLRELLRNSLSRAFG